MRVLHVLHHSIPYLDGYCIRSRQIVEFQKAAGVEVRVITSAQHELEVKRPPEAYVETEEIDGVTYHRTPLPEGAIRSATGRLPFGRQAVFMHQIYAAILRTLRAYPVDILHAHSPVLCGLPTLRAARRAGVPIVYEARGFWEDGFISKWRGGERSFRYRLSRALETHVFKNADAVLAISHQMLNDISARGVEAKKLYRVPNGVDATSFAPLPPDRALIHDHHLEGAVVVGFIGSLYRFEGLETLLKAMAYVVPRVPRAKLAIVGGGEQEHELARLAEALGLRDHVIIVGRVPHQDVNRYYSIMDVLVYPRINSRTTQLTTPLKPLEAMAMGKPVIGSDVGGIREIFADGRVGVLFPAEDEEALAEALIELLVDPGKRFAIGEEGRRYALEERSWQELVQQYLRVYAAVESRERGFR